MNIKTKLILGIGMLAGMIILLVTLSVVNLQILTATEPDSPAATPGLERALLWISVTGGICILTGLILLYWLPRTISKPIKELKEGILEIANHNYEKRLQMNNNEEFRDVADSFNRMAERLTEYRAIGYAIINDCVCHKADAIWSLSPSVGRRRFSAVRARHDEALGRPTQRGDSLAFRSDNDRIKEQE